MPMSRPLPAATHGCHVAELGERLRLGAGQPLRPAACQRTRRVARFEQKFSACIHFPHIFCAADRPDHRHEARPTRRIAGSCVHGAAGDSDNPVSAGLCGPCLPSCEDGRRETAYLHALQAGRRQVPWHSTLRPSVELLLRHQVSRLRSPRLSQALQSSAPHRRARCTAQHLTASACLAAAGYSSAALAAG